MTNKNMNPQPGDIILLKPDEIPLLNKLNAGDPDFLESVRNISIDIPTQVIPKYEEFHFAKGGLVKTPGSNRLFETIPKADPELVALLFASPHHQPCPWCKEIDLTIQPFMTMLRVLCRCCGAQGPRAYREDDAWEKWDAR